MGFVAAVAFAVGEGFMADLHLFFRHLMAFFAVAAAAETTSAFDLGVGVDGDQHRHGQQCRGHGRGGGDYSTQVHADTSAARQAGTGLVGLAEEEKEREWRGYITALQQAAEYGITSIQIPGSADFGMYDSIMAAGMLTSRIDIGAELTAEPEELDRCEALRQRYPSSGNWLRFGYLKDFMDGTLGSATAMMFEPFNDEPDKTGLPQMSYEELEARVLAADSRGFQIGIHAIGPKANNWILNAYEKAREVNGIRDSRHRSEHAQILTEKELPRFAQLGVIASMQPTHCITDKRFAEKRIGTDRSRWAYAWKSLADSGAHLAFGTDYSVEPLNPMEGLYASVTRKDRKGEEGDGWFPMEKITMGKAIEYYTLGAAYAQFMDDRKGMLRKGYLADITILSENIFDISEEMIMSVKADYTIVDGKIVFERNRE